MKFSKFTDGIIKNNIFKYVIGDVVSKTVV
jgi:hypothetical protein